jgi:DNA-directed RNA polymerase subunit M/transcription elongation factor TFIIS
VKFQSDEIDGRQIGNSCIGAFGPDSRPISISNVAENITVTDILKQNNPTKSAWTGGTSENGNEWYWVNDNKITGNYSNWVDGKTPTPNIRHRVAMRSDGFWESKDSWAQAPEGRRPYLCATISEKFSTIEGMEGGDKLQIMMYKRDGSGVTITKMSDINATVVNIADFKPLSLKVSGTKSVLVVPRKLNTFIAVINKDSGNKYTIENSSMYTPSVKLTVAAADTIDQSKDTTDKSKDKSKDTTDQSEYWKKYWYWQTNGESSDYILKTQVIPPVCPACPGTCTSGGNSGGINSASSSSSAIKSVGSDITGAAKDVVAGGTGLAKDVVAGGTGLAKDVVSGGVGLAKDVASGGVGLAKDAVSGGVGLAKDTVSGGVGLAKDVASGGVGLVKDTVSGGVGLVKDTVSGGIGLVKDTVSGGVGLVSDILPTGGSGSNGAGSGGRSGGSGGKAGSKSANDVYTYNGALSNKAPSNFMPVTASFSAFSR